MGHLAIALPLITVLLLIWGFFYFRHRVKRLPCPNCGNRHRQYHNECGSCFEEIVYTCQKCGKEDRY